jgi:hypothetical protein
MSISWLRIIGIISIACSVLLSLAILWYLAVIEIPATESLQTQVFIQADAISILAQDASSSTPPHTMR